MGRSLRAVFFDLDDTLIDHSGAERQAVHRFYEEFGARETGLELASFFAQWAGASRHHLARYLAGSIDFQAQRRARMRQLFGRELSDAAADQHFARYLRHYAANWRAFDDVLPCLERLGTCFRGVISNGDAAQQRQKLGATGLLSYFDDVVVPGGSCPAKPKRAIFERACRRAGVPLGSALHVGDSLNADYHGAVSAGLKALLLARHEPASSPGITQIRSLAELPEFIDGLAC